MPAISTENKAKIREAVRETVYWQHTGRTLEDIAGELNSKLRGWCNYFAVFGKEDFVKLMDGSAESIKSEEGALAGNAWERV